MLCIVDFLVRGGILPIKWVDFSTPKSDSKLKGRYCDHRVIILLHQKTFLSLFLDFTS